MKKSLDSFNCYRELKVGEKTYKYFSLEVAEENGLVGVSKLPYSLKVLVENLLRNEDEVWTNADSIKKLVNSLNGEKSDISFCPSRVLMQDFTGVPAVADLAAMRDAAADLNIPADKINPLIPVDLVIDHSVMVDSFGTSRSFAINIEHEYQRNVERYKFLRWGQLSFENFSVVPPGTGICHQVNLEYLASVVRAQQEENGETVVFPDTVVGTDSHTTMVNALAVLGWGVGGIEAEAAMLGQPISMLMPAVVGFRLDGALSEGVTATDLVLYVVQMLREKGVVGKFVEFYGPGLDSLTVEDRSTIANMAPEYGATCGFFPIDNATIRYLLGTNRDSDHVEMVKEYAKAQGMFREHSSPTPVFEDEISLDISTVTPSLAGPKRPQDRIELGNAADAMRGVIKAADSDGKRSEVSGKDYDLGDGDVVIAAITSCTNTSNPAVLIAAGLLAKKAIEKGLKSKPWVKTSLAPGSQVVTDYLNASGLQSSLDELGFTLAGYGCTTCIGNSGPLDEDISSCIAENNINACAVLSGNRNFEGRINPDVKANFIASPPLVVAYAITGTLLCDLKGGPLGFDNSGEPVYLADIWPSNEEIEQLMNSHIKPELFADRYNDVFMGDNNWRSIDVSPSMIYDWDPASTYIQRPPYFEKMAKEATMPDTISDARILSLFGDSITTDHISPAGSFTELQPAGQYLNEHQVRRRDFNSYGARRGNHNIMMRGTFANIRIRNQMIPGKEGGFTVYQPSGEEMTIFEASEKYAENNVPLIVMAGKEYGTGSSRDWAAKGSVLLGVKAVIAESFERIHRSNLIGMGVLPLMFMNDMSWQSLNITGNEQISIAQIGQITPGCEVQVIIKRSDGSSETITTKCRIDTEGELSYYQNGGILQYMLRSMAA